MARPAKAISMQSDSTCITKAEIAARKAEEDAMRGGSDKLVPPERYSERRKEVFNDVIAELEDRALLGNLDYYVLCKFATSVEMLERIDELIDGNMEEIENAKMRNAREMYSRDFFKCCSELCLSPSSRAKAAIHRAEARGKPATVFDMLDDENDEV